MEREKQECSFLPDTLHGGLLQAEFDEDRMVNEGLSAGSVHLRHDLSNIDATVVPHAESQVDSV